MCGKNAVNVTPWFLRLGSPPRVREKQSAVLNSIDESRITPECAGKTIIKTVSITTSQDHPRVCGKNSPNVRANKRRSGSPPRVREKLIIFPFFYSSTGITPACAGKTSTPGNNPKVQRDHPRVCGKNTILLGIVKRLTGSPPRVREKLSFSLSLSYMYRITPACAGKTSSGPWLPALMRDHPRVCGKNALSKP